VYLSTPPIAFELPAFDMLTLCAHIDFKPELQMLPGLLV
jgi:hypothetical protein